MQKDKTGYVAKADHENPNDDEASTIRILPKKRELQDRDERLAIADGPLALPAPPPSPSQVLNLIDEMDKDQLKAIYKAVKRKLA